MKIDKPKEQNQIYVIIPAFNESKTIAKVIKSIRDQGFSNIIVIDDGSLDDTKEISKAQGAITLSHLINRGKGAATQTGFEAAKLLEADIVVTIDADEQHHAEDIKSIIKPIIDGESDVVLGSRFLKKNDIPKSKKLANRIANIITYIFYGIYVTDSQSGFRAYSKKAIEMIYTDMDRYEFESQILNQIRFFGLSYKEVAISVSYTDYSKNKYSKMKGVQPQNLLNGVKMLFKMVIRSLFL